MASRRVALRNGVRAGCGTARDGWTGKRPSVKHLKKFPKSLKALVNKTLSGFGRNVSRKSETGIKRLGAILQNPPQKACFPGDESKTYFLLRNRFQLK
jgi:hypothetical protein